VFKFVERLLFAYLCDNSRSSIQLCSTEVTPSAKLSKSFSDRSLRVRGRVGNCRPKLNGTFSVCGDSDANRNILCLLRIAALPVATTGGKSLFLTSQPVTLSSGILCYHWADGRISAVMLTYSRQHPSFRVATTRFRHHRSQQAFTVHSNEASKDHSRVCLYATGPNSSTDTMLLLRVFISRWNNENWKSEFQATTPFLHKVCKMNA
jgi:hypothetical protein